MDLQIEMPFTRTCIIIQKILKYLFRYYFECLA